MGIRIFQDFVFVNYHKLQIFFFSNKYCVQFTILQKSIVG